MGVRKWWAVGAFLALSCPEGARAARPAEPSEATLGYDAASGQHRVANDSNQASLLRKTSLVHTEARGLGYGSKKGKKKANKKAKKKDTTNAQKSDGGKEEKKEKKQECKNSTGKGCFGCKSMNGKCKRMTCICRVGECFHGGLCVSQKGIDLISDSDKPKKACKKETGETCTPEVWKQAWKPCTKATKAQCIENKCQCGENQCLRDPEKIASCLKDPKKNASECLKLAECVSEAQLQMDDHDDCDVVDVTDEIMGTDEATGAVKQIGTNAQDMAGDEMRSTATSAVGTSATKALEATGMASGLSGAADVTGMMEEYMQCPPTRGDISMATIQVGKKAAKAFAIAALKGLQVGVGIAAGGVTGGIGLSAGPLVGKLMSGVFGSGEEEKEGPEEVAEDTASEIKGSSSSVKNFEIKSLIGEAYATGHDLDGVTKQLQRQFEDDVVKLSLQGCSAGSTSAQGAGLGVESMEKGIMEETKEIVTSLAVAEQIISQAKATSLEGVRIKNVLLQEIEIATEDVEENQDLFGAEPLVQRIRLINDMLDAWWWVFYCRSALLDSALKGLNAAGCNNLVRASLYQEYQDLATMKQRYAESEATWKSKENGLFEKALDEMNDAVRAKRKIRKWKKGKIRKKRLMHFVPAMANMYTKLKKTGDSEAALKKFQDLIKDARDEGTETWSVVCGKSQPWEDAVEIARTFDFACDEIAGSSRWSSCYKQKAVVGNHENMKNCGKEMIGLRTMFTGKSTTKYCCCEKGYVYDYDRQRCRKPCGCER